MLMHSHECPFTTPLLFSISKQNRLSGWRLPFILPETGCIPLLWTLKFLADPATRELNDFIDPWWLLLTTLLNAGFHCWQSIFHFSYLSPGFFNVRNSIKGWKLVLYFSLIIFFLNRITDGSTINLGSVAKHVTNLLRESFLMKFSKYKGS